MHEHTRRQTLAGMRDRLRAGWGCEECRRWRRALLAVAALLAAVWLSGWLLPA